jgi:hypothetical protein
MTCTPPYVRSGTTPRSPPKSPVRAMRKNNPFSSKNPYKKKSATEKINGNFITIEATRGDEEAISILKGNDPEVDAYVLNIRDDIEANAEYIAELFIASCSPKRLSKEEHVVALSRGKRIINIWSNHVNSKSS